MLLQTFVRFPICTSMLVLTTYASTQGPRGSKVGFAAGKSAKYLFLFKPGAWERLNNEFHAQAESLIRFAGTNYVVAPQKYNICYIRGPSIGLVGFTWEVHQDNILDMAIFGSLNKLVSSNLTSSRFKNIYI